MPAIDDVQLAVDRMLDAMREYVDEASNTTWSPSDGFLFLIVRAILRRQFEALEAIAGLVKGGKAYVAGPLLRPACEELIWTKYLLQIPQETAERLVVTVASKELLANLSAQDKYAGRKVTEELGLLPYLERSRGRKAAHRKTLEELSTELGWPVREGQGAELPSIYWIAKQTEQLRVYNFIYHATSRFVHFSVTELLRRAWGHPGTVSITSEHYRDYWGHFSLYWGLNLFIDTAIEIAQGLSVDATIDEAAFLDAAERIGEFGAVPIITADELDWPEESVDSEPS